MAVFPSITPIYPLSETTAPIVSKTRLGDGYTAFHRMGLSSTRPEWQLEWLLEWTEAQTIDTFLRARSTAEETFEWQPPDAIIALSWRCSDWSVEQQADGLFRVSALFRRAFELIPSALTPVATDTCYQDKLCNDFGTTISSTIAGQNVIISGQLPICTGQYTYVKITYISPSGSATSEYYNLTTGNVTVNGATYSYSLNGTTIQTAGSQWEISRWLDYLRAGYKIATDAQCSPNINPTAITWPPTPNYGDPTLLGPVTSDWTPTNGGYPLVYTGTCQYKQTCLKWEASGYGQTSFVQVCRGATLTQFGPAFWGGFGGIGDPSQTYKYPQFYYSFCDGYSSQIVNNGGAIYLPYTGARLPEFHLSVYYP